MNPVAGFTFNKKFLSNFHLCNIEFEGLIFPSTENAYQAAKTTDLKMRRNFMFITPSAAKALGRKLKIRPDFEHIKLEVMTQLIDLKFEDPKLARKLFDTGTQQLIEYNHWHDNFWGSCYCDSCKDIYGTNHLGRILMAKRECIRNLFKIRVGDENDHY